MSSSNSSLIIAIICITLGSGLVLGGGGIIGYFETKLPGHMTIHSLNPLDQNRRLINTVRVKLRVKLRVRLRVKGKHVNISLNTI